MDPKDYEEAFKYLHRVTKYGQCNPIGDYMIKHSLRQKEILERLRQNTIESCERATQMCAPEEAQLFTLLLKLINAKKCIEIGIFTGYNLLNTALAIAEDGKIVGCDVNEDFFNLSKELFEEAGVLHKLDLRFQPATKTLDELLAAGEGNTFDFVFIDADKTGYDTYYEKSLQLLKTGGLIAVDNVLWSGKVTVDPAKHCEDTKCIHELNQKIHQDKRVDISMLPVADGVTLCRKI